jgi:hypothetical protein
MMPAIRAELPDAELHIFGYQPITDQAVLDQLTNTPYAFNHGGVSQDQLAIEILKSDIWLYPTNFKETYCITALEMMMGRTVIVTNNLAAMPDTVQDRGVVIELPPEGVDSEPYKLEMIKAAIAILRDPARKAAYVERAYEWAKQQTWQQRALDWKQMFDNPVLNPLPLDHAAALVQGERLEEAYAKYEQVLGPLVNSTVPSDEDHVPAAAANIPALVSHSNDLWGLERRYQSALKAGQMCERIPTMDINSCVHWYMNASAIHPNRAEPFYRIGQLYRGRKVWTGCYNYSAKAFDMNYPGPDQTLEAKSLYDVDIPVQLNVCAFWARRFEEGIVANLRALFNAPNNERLLQNLDLYLSRLSAPSWVPASSRLNARQLQIVSVLLGGLGNRLAKRNASVALVDKVLLLAHKMAPTKLSALYELANYYRDRKNWTHSFKHIMAAFNMDRPEGVLRQKWEDYLFEYGVPETVQYVSWQVRDWQAGHAAMTRLATYRVLDNKMLHNKLVFEHKVNNIAQEFNRTLLAYDWKRGDVWDKFDATFEPVNIPFSVVVHVTEKTSERLESWLSRLLALLSTIPFLEEVFVLSPEPLPESLKEGLATAVRLVPQEGGPDKADKKKALRFDARLTAVADEIKTDAVLLLDHFSSSTKLDARAIEQLLAVHHKYPDVISGPMASAHMIGGYSRSRYVHNESIATKLKWYHLVMPQQAVVSRRHLQSYARMDAKFKKFADRNPGCHGLLFNFHVAFSNGHQTNRVIHRNVYPEWKGTATASKEADKCVNALEALYGVFPLRIRSRLLHGLEDVADLLSVQSRGRAHMLPLELEVQQLLHRVDIGEDIVISRYNDGEYRLMQGYAWQGWSGWSVDKGMSQTGQDLISSLKIKRQGANFVFGLPCLVRF